MTWTLLHWKDVSSHEEASLGTPDDGVQFSLVTYSTCYRRGPYRLLVEICTGEHHFSWGCFDDQDQPMRWFHHLENAKSEAEAIARVLLKDRMKCVPLPSWTEPESATVPDTAQ